MKLSSQKTVDASIDRVFAAITEFTAFEVMLRERGAHVEQTSGSVPPDVGAKWKARFKWHERAYDVQTEMVSVDPGVGYAIESKGNGIVCMGVVDLEAIDERRTRLFVSFDLAATTFASRLLLQTLRLTGASLNRRLDKRVSAYVERIENKA